MAIFAPRICVHFLTTLISCAENVSIRIAILDPFIMFSRQNCPIIGWWTFMFEANPSRLRNTFVKTMLSVNEFDSRV